MSNERLMGSALKIGPLIGRVKRKMHKRMSDLLKPYGITPEQRAILLTLIEKGPMTQAQLCELTSTEPSNLSTTLKRLLQKEYILKVDHPEDPRAYLIKASKKTKEAAQELAALSAFIDERLIKGIEPEMFTAAVKVLETIDKNLDDLSL
ncbi:MarR family transcriptional regulator [Sulfurimonas sp. HSL-1716]|uniref:MarR family winged helix-turn-helix transcriptional regulator n=1 Tax=Hydrocurvibacter sulfurireducens TaxID=3131937 RepID=UPI0031F73DD3